jgi:glucose-1-phosphate adenylyltransferase
MNFADLIEQHLRTKAEVTIAAKAMPTDTVEGLGLMRVDDNLAIREFAEKPKDPAVIEALALSSEVAKGLKASDDRKYVLANMGIYCFNMKTLRASLDGTDTDFGREVIPGLLGKAAMNGYIFEGYWEDIGTVRSFFDANLSLTDTVPPFNFFDQNNHIYTRARYLPASKINSARIDRAIVAGGGILTEASLERVVVGVRSVIGRGTKFKNVVMMGADIFEDEDDRARNRSLGRPDVGVGENCVIEEAIIDKNARIGSNVKLSPHGKPDMFQSGDVIVRDGVLVVQKGAVIPDGTEV